MQILIKVEGLSAKLPLSYFGEFYKNSYLWHFLKKSFDFVDLEVGRDLDNFSLPPPSTSASM